MTIKPFQITGTDGRTVLQFGPRYTRPVDDTTMLSVFHRTLDGGVGVLLEREAIPAIAEWLDDSSDEMLLRGVQTFSVWRKFPSGYITVKCEWHGSGRARTVSLSARDAKSVYWWLTKIDRDGWDGWKTEAAA